MDLSAWTGGAEAHGGGVSGAGGSAAPWPLDLLDVAALRGAGTAPVPFRQFVLKLHSRCNLACTYCYLYEGPDQTWKDRPARLSPRTARHAVVRIAEHVIRHRIPAIRVEFHGGEPLLRGAAPLVELAESLRAAVPAWCEVSYTVQTNGTLLTERGLERLGEAGISVGLSVDGGSAELNRRRVDKGGRPSWPAVARAARLLGRHPEHWAGLLATIDVDTSPDEVFRSLLDLRPPALNLLLPHANWSSPPPGGPGRYGEWLVRVFDLWWDAERPGPPIRFFQEIIGLLLGRSSTTEAVGLSPVAAVVVDTDGSVEQVDSIRSAYHGAARTGLDVFRHSFDAALDHPGVAARQLGLAGLAPNCRRCPLVRVCGGGNYAHRFREGSGFLNPSVYCLDLERVIRHVAGKIQQAVSSSAAQTRRAAEGAATPVVQGCGHSHT